MRFWLILSVVLTMVAGIVIPAFAHDGSIGSLENPVEFPGLAVQDFQHQNEQAPWKGSLFVFVKNTGAKAWTDFHFKVTSWGDDVSTVDFKDASMGGVDPISTQHPLTWTINNNVVGAEMNLFFASDPVLPGQVATFQLYTDNTAGQVQFGVCMMPSVPEPSAMAALATGLLGLVGIVRRKKA
jgi:hypothetical protein